MLKAAVFFGPNFGAEAFVVPELMLPTAVEALLDRVTTVPYRLFSSAFTFSQNLPLLFAVADGRPPLFASAVLRSVQKVPLAGCGAPVACRLFSSASSASQNFAFWPRWTTVPVRLFSSASRASQNAPWGRVLPLVPETTEPAVEKPLFCCLFASSLARSCMKDCCLVVMLSLTIFCGSERNCWMKSVLLSNFCADGDVMSFCTAIAPDLNVSSCWAGSKNESSVSPLADVDRLFACLPACKPALLMSSVPDCTACLLMLFQKRFGRSP